VLWIALGFLLTSFGLALLSYATDWPGAGRDRYLRSLGAGGGFLAVLGLVCNLYAHTQGNGYAFASIVASLLVAAAAAGFLRYRKRSFATDTTLQSVSGDHGIVGPEGVDD
jgi:hypothetical protein